MSLILGDRIRQTSTTTGSGTFTLDGSVTGFQSFSAVGEGNTTYYTISLDSQWEVGIGTYSAGTLSRDTVLSSSTGSKVAFLAGAKDVFVSYPAEKSVNLDASGYVQYNGNSYQDNANVAAPAFQEGRLWYDSTQKALSYYNDITNNTIHIGQETQLKVRNSTGSTIGKGVPVYILNTSSGVAYPNIALAKADTQTTGNCIGLTNQSIANGADGYVVISGLVTGLSIGSYTVGDILYVSPYSAGQLMNTFPPTGYPVRVGVVAYANTPNGSIYVNQSNAYVTAGAIVGQVAVANGGTGTATPSLVAGTNISISGSWPNQTVTASSGSGTVTSVDASVPSFLSISGNPITSSGTLAITYSGTALPIANGGTGQTTASAAFNALSPITTAGDLILGNGTNTATRLAIGANGYVLTSNGTTASWAANSGSGISTGKSIAMAMIFGF